jgi:hypothetical protein
MKAKICLKGPGQGIDLIWPPTMDIRDDIGKGIQWKDVTLEVHKKLKRIYEADLGRSYPYELPDDTDLDTSEGGADNTQNV